MSALDANSRSGEHAIDTAPLIGNPKRHCLAVSGQRYPAEPSKATVSANAGLAGNSSPASSSPPTPSPTSSAGRAVHIPVPSVSSVSQVLYLHTDVLGSVVAESDSSGQLKTSTQYKPFGEVVNN